MKEQDTPFKQIKRVTIQEKRWGHDDYYNVIETQVDAQKFKNGSRVRVIIEKLCQWKKGCEGVAVDDDEFDCPMCQECFDNEMNIAHPEKTPDGYDKVCDFMGCENEANIWYHISVHCCNKGTVDTSCCPECAKKIFDDD
jgi:hypothetical protein